MLEEESAMLLFLKVVPYDSLEEFEKVVGISLALLVKEVFWANVQILIWLIVSLTDVENS